MSAGFLGIQLSFALQNGNASRILQTFGADVEHLSLFWLVAPLTGMLIQPLVGYYSDQTWNRFGRRRPYVLAGTLFTVLALLLLPNAAVLTNFLKPVVVGALLLMLLDASINITMEPFRALIADKLPDIQRSQGYAMQTFLIGLGAVLGSCLPFVLAEWGGVAKTAPTGQVPDNVVFSFYAGAILLLASVLWTVFTTPEYSPEELLAHDSAVSGERRSAQAERLSGILEGIRQMPPLMKHLGLVQFFSWFAFFAMWVYTTPALAQHVFNVEPGDSSSTGFADAGNWTGLLFGVYNGVSAIYALVIPRLSRHYSRKNIYSMSLLLGGLSLLSFVFISEADHLIWVMVGVGVAWGGILSMPYAILASRLPATRMGLYMGLFNIFITLPQIVSGLLTGWLLHYVFDGQALYILLLAGFSLLLASLAAWRIGNL